jgi:hypothetical protein
MSAKNAEKLLQRVKNEAGIRAKLKRAGAADFEQAASDAGCACTPEEFAAAVKNAVTKLDIAKDGVFVADGGIVSGVSSGVSGHVGAVGSGIA